MSWLFTQVKQIIDELDPAGLLAMGCPSDEYDSESEQIAAMIAAGEPITEKSLTAYWQQQFGDFAPPQSIIREMVRRLSALRA